MRDKGPIAGLVTLVVVAIGGVVAVFSPRPSDLPAKVQAYFDKADAQTPPERHREVSAQIAELQTLADDPEFAKLPKPKQETVTGRLTELNAYQGYSQEMDAVASPASVSNEATLKEIETQLAKIKVPVEYQVEWSQTEAGLRHRQLQDAARALDRAVADTERSYRKVADEAQELHETSEKADLPGRARKIIAEAEKLPTPVADKDKPVPGSKEVTYAAVFRFERVNAEYQRWEKGRPLLKRLASLGK